MSKDERHMLTKIRLLEDLLLRAKDTREQELIRKDLTKLKIQQQKIGFQKASP